MRHIFTTSADLTMKKWSVATGDVELTFSNVHKEDVNACLVMSKEPYVFSGCVDGYIVKWNKNNANPELKVRAHVDRIFRMCFSHDEQYLFSGSFDCKGVAMWNTSDLTRVRVFSGRHEFHFLQA